MTFTGPALDDPNVVTGESRDPETRAAGAAHPRYKVSDVVSVSRDGPFHIYHVSHGELGLGASFGNRKTWAETKGTGDFLNLFSVELGELIMGGTSVSYLLPFRDLTREGVAPTGEGVSGVRLARLLPSAQGEIHLHPAYQQREFVVGDGLYVLETFYVPRSGDDPCAACTTVFLKNATPRPLHVYVVAAVSLRGKTGRDLVASFDNKRGCLLAFNRSHPERARILGTRNSASGFSVTANGESTYAPEAPLPCKIGAEGDLFGAIQTDVRIGPNESHKISFFTGFSPRGADDATKAFEGWRADEHVLEATVEGYRKAMARATIECPDRAISEGVSWAKACLLRPLAEYRFGIGATNDPGKSSSVVGRDSAWYVYGSDYVSPEVSCSLLRALANAQRDDGLIPEFINGVSGKSEFFDFNINDDTALFLMGAHRHLRCVGHESCRDALLEPMIRAGDLVLRQIDDRGLVVCTADGLGAKGICGWRNVLENQQISGAVTELNAECYAGLMGLAEVCEQAGRAKDALRFKEHVKSLRAAINKYLIDPQTGLYVQNIDPDGNVCTQATVDMVFPLFCGVAEEKTRRAVCRRLSEPDFSTSAGLRVLSQENPSYDPSKESGCLGGIWAGATWWYAMGKVDIDPGSVAELLGEAYRHYLRQPKAFNTVPGQFSEWSDGETFANRGMRLSPWAAPRFIWVAVEGLAGIKPGWNDIEIRPSMPKEWDWMCASDVQVRGQSISYFVVRRGAGFELFTNARVKFSGTMFVFESRVTHPETLTTGVSTAAFANDGEVVVALGNSRHERVGAPFYTEGVIHAGGRYRLESLVSPGRDWEELGVFDAKELRQLEVDLEPLGYVLVRFRQED